MLVHLQALTIPAIAAASVRAIRTGGSQTVYVVNQRARESMLAVALFALAI
jgi:hypothetical protein